MADIYIFSDSVFFPKLTELDTWLEIYNKII